MDDGKVGSEPEKVRRVFAVRSIRHCGTKNLPHLLEQARPDIFKLVTEWKSVAHAGRLSFVSVLASHPTLQYPILVTSRASEGHYIVDIRGKDACLKILQLQRQPHEQLRNLPMSRHPVAELRTTS